MMFNGRDLWLELCLLRGVCNQYNLGGGGGAELAVSQSFFFFF